MKNVCVFPHSFSIVSSTVGSAKSRVVNDCREAIKKRKYEALYSIVRYVPQFCMCNRDYGLSVSIKHAEVGRSEPNDVNRQREHVPSKQNNRWAPCRRQYSDSNNAGKHRYF